ncbi:glycosyltransferase family 87 protein [Streptomyces sp. TRM 70361]|uniref:glycosyltransferase family 87 protein n=1 Tax=Streptomyces sp. TRM 70361 TaxID=3116553 RepID=UPI002E7ADCE8|nr:glycosyltransferase family 87 protein [Streptomyces sp. TRM 70361]MEE1942478.1 glycosyltransferase family 87 protein [Streptomyces sp. TRM 70361]
MRLSLAAWAATRTVLLLCVFKVITVPGPDVTSDVSVIYHGWYEVLRTGSFPAGDVTWQYPPAAALAVLSPALLPFLAYPAAFYTLVCAADAVVFAMLLYASRRAPERGRGRAGVWVWVAGVPLLGPTVYARYDLMVTAVAVAALLALSRSPRAAGALAAFGALLKVWPALLLAGTPRGRTTRVAWGTAVATGLVLTALFAAAMPGALDFLTHQRDRGTEVESLGALVFHVARHFGWEGQVLLNYGSVEFLGPHVETVSTVAMVCSAAAFGWLLLWRLRAVEWTASTAADAAFAAVLLFTVTSRVISPQYMVWLVGLAAVCTVLRTGRQGLPALLVVVATGVTLLEFPVYFGNVVASDALGVTLLVLRNGLLLAAAVLACARLWRTTVTEPRRRAAGGRDGDGTAGAGEAAGREPAEDRLLSR